MGFPQRNAEGAAGQAFVGQDAKLQAGGFTCPRCKCGFLPAPPVPSSLFPLLRGVDAQWIFAGAVVLHMVKRGPIGTGWSNPDSQRAGVSGDEVSAGMPVARTAVSLLFQRQSTMISVVCRPTAVLAETLPPLNASSPAQQ